MCRLLNTFAGEIHRNRLAPKAECSDFALFAKRVRSYVMPPILVSHFVGVATLSWMKDVDART